MLRKLPSLLLAVFGFVPTALFARFEQMLANGGELDGVRILAPRTVELMQTNHVADLFHGMRSAAE